MDFNLFIGKKIIELESVDSTNNYLSKYINKTNVLDGTVILAHNQTSGKGQRGNSWESENGKNLTFSIYLKTDFIKIDHSFYLSMAVCNALHELMTEHTTNAKIKWPNDILINKKKVSGVLIENSIQNHSLKTSIIGIGINVNQLKFSVENITSIALEASSEVNKNILIHCFFQFLEKYFNLLKQGETKKLKAYYLSHLIGYQTELNYLIVKENIAIIGEILDVKDNGFLVMKIDRKVVREFEMKEVKLIN